MNKTVMLKVLNPVLAVLLLNQPLTGLLYSTFDLEFFEGLHIGGGVTLLMAAAIHGMLNWSWIRANFLQPRR